MAASFQWRNPLTVKLETPITLAKLVQKEADLQKVYSPAAEAEYASLEKDYCSKISK
ncbi:MAG: hypothetical protein H7222_17670 [Methylotenera sp.]|nr:hypothetical protein [Oligoflexia bacterium]